MTKKQVLKKRKPHKKTYKSKPSKTKRKPYNKKIQHASGKKSVASQLNPEAPVFVPHVNKAISLESVDFNDYIDRYVDKNIMSIKSSFDNTEIMINNAKQYIDNSIFKDTILKEINKYIITIPNIVFVLIDFENITKVFKIIGEDNKRLEQLYKVLGNPPINYLSKTTAVFNTCYIIVKPQKYDSQPLFTNGTLNKDYNIYYLTLSVPCKHNDTTCDISVKYNESDDIVLLYIYHMLIYNTIYCYIVSFDNYNWYKNKVHYYLAPYYNKEVNIYTVLMPLYKWLLSK